MPKKCLNFNVKLCLTSVTNIMFVAQMISLSIRFGMTVKISAGGQIADKKLGKLFGSIRWPVLLDEVYEKAYFSRLIMLARYPAPKPLSMLTTQTPLAQLLSMVSRADRPLKLAP